MFYVSEIFTEKPTEFKAPLQKRYMRRSLSKIFLLSAWIPTRRSLWRIVLQSMKSFR